MKNYKNVTISSHPTYWDGWAVIHENSIIDIFDNKESAIHFCRNKMLTIIAFVKYKHQPNTLFDL